MFYFKIACSTYLPSVHKAVYRSYLVQQQQPNTHRTDWLTGVARAVSITSCKNTGLPALSDRRQTEEEIDKQTRQSAVHPPGIRPIDKYIDKSTDWQTDIYITCTERTRDNFLHASVGCPRFPRQPRTSTRFSNFEFCAHSNEQSPHPTPVPFLREKVFGRKIINLGKCTQEHTFII